LNGEGEAVTTTNGMIPLTFNWKKGTEPPPVTLRSLEASQVGEASLLVVPSGRIQEKLSNQFQGNQEVTSAETTTTGWERSQLGGEVMVTEDTGFISAMRVTAIRAISTRKPMQSPPREHRDLDLLVSNSSSSMGSFFVLKPKVGFEVDDRMLNIVLPFTFISFGLQ
jgi:hypothetical protein